MQGDVLGLKNPTLVRSCCWHLDRPREHSLDLPYASSLILKVSLVPLSLSRAKALLPVPRAPARIHDRAAGTLALLLSTRQYSDALLDAPLGRTGLAAEPRAVHLEVSGPIATPATPYPSPATPVAMLVTRQKSANLLGNAPQ